MSDEIYQLTTDNADVTMPTANGLTKVRVYKGALIPGASPEVEHLVAGGYAVKAIADDTGGLNADGVPLVEVEQQAKAGKKGSAKSDLTEPVVEDPDPFEAGPDVEARRAAARDRLAELGDKAPDGRASKDVLVEYLVASGSRYEDLASAEKAELVEMVKARQQ